MDEETLTSFGDKYGYLPYGKKRFKLKTHTLITVLPILCSESVFLQRALFEQITTFCSSFIRCACDWCRLTVPNLIEILSLVSGTKR